MHQPILQILVLSLTNLIRDSEKGAERQYQNREITPDESSHVANSITPIVPSCRHGHQNFDEIQPAGE